MLMKSYCAANYFVRFNHIAQRSILLALSIQVVFHLPEQSGSILTIT